MFRSEDLQLLAAMNLYSIKALLTYFIIQLIFLQQYFPIPVPCNITRYCMGVIARAQGLRGILATTMCFN